MQNITTTAGLREAIIVLESKRIIEEKELKEQLHITYESIKPINIIKTVYNEIAASDNLKTELVNTSVGLVAGYASKVLFESVSHSPIRKLIGTALLFGVTTTVAKHPEKVKTFAKVFFNLIKSVSSQRTSQQLLHEAK